MYIKTKWCNNPIYSFKTTLFGLKEGRGKKNNNKN